MIAQLSRYLKRFDIRISLIYGVIAILWISFSDLFPPLIFNDNHAIQTTVNTLIGWGFVVVTTGALYLLLSAELRKRTQVENELQLERDISPIAIAVFGIDGRITYANSQAEKTLGKPRSEIIGKLFDDSHFHVTDYAGNPVDVMPIIMQLAQTKQTVYGIQQAILSASGERILLEINLAPLINNHGEITAIVGTFTDVTTAKNHEKQLRDSEERFRLLFNNNPLPVAVYDPDTLAFIEVNDATLDHYGYTREEFLKMVVADLRLVDDTPELIEDTQKIFQNMQRTERQHRLKDGRIIDVHVTSQIIDYNGRKAVMAVAHDITKRKQSEKALRDSEYSLKQAQAIAHVGDWSWDKQSNTIRWSDEMYTIYGIDQSAFTGNPNNIIPMVIHPDDHDIGMEINAALLDGKTRSTWEYRIIWPDRSIRYLRVESGDTHFNPDGTISKLSGIVQDITERKLSEQALRESERSLKRAQSVARVGDWSWDIKTNAIHASDEIYTILGLDKATFTGDLSYIVEHVIHPDDETLLINAVEMSMRGQKPENFECRVIWPDRSVHDIWAEVGEEIIEQDGTISSMSGIIQDITDRKQAERALRESEASLKLAQAIAHLGNWTQDLRTNTAHWSDEMYRIFGLQKDENIHNLNVVLASAVHPDDREIVQRANESVIRERKGGVWEFRVVWPDGSVHHIEAETPAPITDSEGNIIQLSGIVQDITERKQAETALRESELRYRTLIEQASDGIYLATREGKFLDVNTSGCHMIGYTREALLQMSIPDVVKFTPERPLRFDELRNGKTVINEFELIRSDGTSLAVEISSKQLSDGNIQGIVRDITERKAAEQALRDSEIRYRSLIEQASEAIFVAEIHGYYVEANTAACMLLGYTRDEILQKKMLDLFIITPDKPLRETELMQGKTLLNERQMIRKDGSLVSVEVSSKLLTNGSIQAIARDITERKRAEQDLRLKSTALDSAGNGIVITDVNGTIEWINPAFTYLTGYKLDEVLGHNPRDLVRSGLHNHLFYEDLWSTILAGNVWKGELVNRRKDGTLYTEEQTITPVRDDTGKITHFVAIQQDVTARKLAEAAVHRLNTELEERVIERTTQLNHIKNRIESILNSNADSIVYSNINGFIEQINPAFTQTFGYEPDEISLQPLKVLVAEKDLAEFEAAVENVTLNRQVQQVDVNSSRKDGTTFDAAMMLSPVIESNNHMVGIVVSIHDVTSRNMMLHHAMDLNELKSRYVAMAAHDLRNPMAVVLSSASGLEGYYDKLTPERRQAKFDQIKSNIKVMTDILNDILVMGQVDSGKMEFRPAPLDVIALCQTIITEAIEGSGTTTKVDFVTHEINNWMLMDAKLLRHILSNLLSNAIKYSPAGSTVTFKVGCTDGKVEFSIRDEGIGIPKDDQARLFETFHRASNAKHIRGTGLGLAIAKQSVELHGGTISFESQEGKGTTFTIHLPASES